MATQNTREASVTEHSYIPKTGRWTGKSLPTEWNGIPFRSRLEARWAVFFDSLDKPVRYEYEVDVFDTPFGPYLPDFYLPELNYFWIVKPGPITELEDKKCLWLALHGHGVFKAQGSIPKTFYPWRQLDRTFTADGWFPNDSEPCILEDSDYTWLEAMGFPRQPYAFGWGDSDLAFCECLQCGTYGIQYEGRSERNCDCSSGDRGHGGPQPNIENALRIARMIRFDRFQ